MPPHFDTAIFDLDNTLLAGDSDHAWGEFLVDQGVVDGQHFREANTRFYRQYRDGTLDMDEYLRFALAPIACMDDRTLEHWQDRYMREVVEDMILDKALALLDAHRRLGRRLVIATATNAVVTRPIADRLGVEHLVATDVERVDERYTGRPQGIATLGRGKLDKVRQWLLSDGGALDRCLFYSDSRNDLPLLEEVAVPVAVDPDPVLRAVAVDRRWPVCSLR